MKKVIMIVTNRYDPDVRVHKEAIYLKSRGYEVEILCWDRGNEYKKRANEVIDGIKITRFFPHSKYGSGIKQIFGFIKFIKEINRYLENVEYNYLHCHDLDGVIAGVFVNKEKAVLIFDMHEFYEVLNSNQKYRLIIKNVVSIFQNKSDWIIYVNEVQINEIKKKNRDKLIFLPNYPDLNNYNLDYKLPDEKIRISYIGSVRQYNELKAFMDACNNLDDIQVLIHGMGVAYEKLQGIIHNYSNVTMTGVFDFKQSRYLYSTADILYAVYPMDNLQNKLSYPVKFYEAILTNTPVIVSKGSVLEKFLYEHDIGFVVDGNDKESISKVVNEIIRDRDIIRKKKLNMQKIQFNYIWDSVVKNLNNIYID